MSTFLFGRPVIFTDREGPLGKLQELTLAPLTFSTLFGRPVIFTEREPSLGRSANAPISARNARRLAAKSERKTPELALAPLTPSARLECPLCGKTSGEGPGLWLIVCADCESAPGEA